MRSDLKAEEEVCISKFFPDIKLGAEDLGRKKGGLKKECRLSVCQGKRKKSIVGQHILTQSNLPIPSPPPPSLPPNASKVS